MVLGTARLQSAVDHGSFCELESMGAYCRVPMRSQGVLYQITL
jgi:hypothetical protein